MTYMVIALAMALAACTIGPQETGPAATAEPTPTETQGATPTATATPTAAPTPTPAPTRTPTPTLAPTPESTPAPTPTPEPTPQATYTVQPGDTLGEIADRFGATVEQLQAWNYDGHPSLATDPDLIEVGWVLEVTGPPDATVPPQPTPEPTPTSTPSADLYVDDYCTVRDWLTPFRAYDQHELTVLDWTYMVGPDYVPPDLVATASAGFDGVSGEKLIRQIVVADLAALREAAAAAGHAIKVQSAYRSYQTQADTFAYWVEQAGLAEALNTSARPGHSQHQLGTTIDFTSGGIPPWQYDDWGATPAGAWMAENAWRYGWVLTYPPGSEDQACYTYEPWHYRWVGREMAADWRASGLIFHEYQVRLGERLAE